MKPFLRQQLSRYTDRQGELEFLLSREDIMKDMEQFLKLSREHTDVSAVASRWARFQQREADLATAQEMLAGADGDADMLAMAQEEMDGATAEMAQLEAELQRMLLPKDPDDQRPAFMEIRAGTGGDESTLFAADLARMYTRYCDSLGFKTEIMSASESELNGYKEVVLRIDGSCQTATGSCGAYGMLKFESGGHRVQRVPATETQGRIHT
ncbi:MAG: PCRF domain-containing protein, partial [Acidovorax sp.]|nr:PCRF domain-containing protein [Acidovorax sp.]